MTLTKLASATLLALLVSTAALAQDKAAPKAEAKHKLAIQVNDNNPATMTLALNNVQNVLSHYKARGETVDIQLVAYGPGLHIYRDDTSPVKARIATMALENPQVTFAACGNTQQNQSKAESKEVKLISEAKVVPSGVVTLMELQKSGYAYIRP